VSEENEGAASCEACGARIEPGTERCPECGNSPGYVIASLGVATTFVGGMSTTVSVPAGVGVGAVGVAIAAVGRFGTFEASEWDTTLSD
jgi:uncharacterized OB-fold protein